MDVSIIIVNYNIIQYMLDTISSVFEKTKGIDYEIIVVDNNSSDNSKEIIARQYGSRVTYLALPENIGFGRANNEGAKAARGRYLFFLNPDTILINNAVKILSDYMDAHPKAGCCGGNLFDIDKKPNISFLRYWPSSFFAELNRLLLGLPEKLRYGKSIDFNYTERPLNVGYISGADLMISKALFNELGGFSKEFFMYYEETELEWRIKKRGLLRMNVPFAHIIHLQGKSIQNNYEREKRLYAMRNVYLRKTKPAWQICLINMLFSLTCFLHIVLWNILGKREKVKRWRFLYEQIINPPPPHKSPMPQEIKRRLYKTRYPRKRGVNGILRGIVFDYE